MESTLNAQELETLATKVSEKIYARIMADESQKELQAACANYTKQMIEYYLTENAVSFDVAKMLKPIYEEHLKNSAFPAEAFREYIQGSDFKKIEISQLRSLLSIRERELMELEQGETNDY
jgi:hypothetical protein